MGTFFREIYYNLKEGQLTPIMINITIKVSTLIYSVDISWYMGTDIWTRIVISILFAIIKMDCTFIEERLNKWYPNASGTKE